MSKNSTARSAAVSLLILSAAVVLLIMGLTKHGLLGRTDPLGPQVSLDEVTLETTAGDTFELRRESWYLLVIGTIEHESQLLKRLEVLLRSPRFHAGNLIPIGLLDGEQEDIAEFLEKNPSSFPILPLHGLTSRSLSQLGIQDHRTAYALISPELTVEFYSEFLKPSDLRLLLEKHFESKLANSKAAATQPPLRRGDVLPHFDLEPLVGASDELDRTREHLWIVFTSACVTCILQNRLHELADSQDAIIAAAFAENISSGVIFGRNRPRAA